MRIMLDVIDSYATRRSVTQTRPTANRHSIFTIALGIRALHSDADALRLGYLHSLSRPASILNLSANRYPCLLQTRLITE